MKSVMSTYIRRFLVVALTTGVMGSPGWGQEIETAVTSFVIGGVTLQEDVKNPPVPSGMQRFEITMNRPVVTIHELREPEIIGNFDGDNITPVTITKSFDIDRDFISYPTDMIIEILTAPDLAASSNSLTLTGTINLPAGAIYQVLFGQSDIDPLDEQQQYFFGTAELPDAVVSGVGILPDGFRVDDDAFYPGWVGLVDPERFSKVFPLLAEDDDLILLSIIRMDDLDEQVMFELKHVPDGSYAMIMGLDVVDREGNEVEVIDQRGINLWTGEVDPTEFIQVVNGKSVTDLQIMFQTERKPEIVRNGDLDGDGDVDFSDFLLFVSAFGTIEGGPGYNPAADLDEDGAIEFPDFLIFASAFGKPVG